MKNYKDAFYYFVKKYREQTGRDYHYYKNRLGLELIKIKRLRLMPDQFIAFINWLYNKKKLSSINFLFGQLNDYYSSVEYSSEQEVRSQLLHYKLMNLRSKIVDSCIKCRGKGYIGIGVKCSCLKKFLKLRHKLRLLYESKTNRY